MFLRAQKTLFELHIEIYRTKYRENP